MEDSMVPSVERDSYRANGVFINAVPLGRCQCEARKMAAQVLNTRNYPPFTAK